MRSDVKAEVDLDACEVFVADPEKVARVRAQLIAPREVAALAETFRVLGDPTRVRILDALSAAELCVCDLATLLGLTESAVSHQLSLLRHMRVVRSRRDGRMVFYALDDQHVISLFKQGLHHVEEAETGSRAPATLVPAEERR
jgi:ArsR family transcriptional regulator, lead/cadmium/zinc/bismuth-responsive transcriptional repressor